MQVVPSFFKIAQNSFNIVSNSFEIVANCFKSGTSFSGRFYKQWEPDYQTCKPSHDIYLAIPFSSDTRDDESDSSSHSDYDDDDSKDFQEDNYVADLSRQPLSSIGPLGEWEAHTKVHYRIST